MDKKKSKQQDVLVIGAGASGMMQPETENVILQILRCLPGVITETTDWYRKF